MMMTRRDFVTHAAAASAAVPAIAHAQLSAPTRVPVQTKGPITPVAVRVGMTDWNLGQRGDISKIASRARSGSTASR